MVCADNPDAPPEPVVGRLELSSWMQKKQVGDHTGCLQAAPGSNLLPTASQQLWLRLPRPSACPGPHILANCHTITAIALTLIGRCWCLGVHPRLASESCLSWFTWTSQYRRLAATPTTP